MAIWRKMRPIWVSVEKAVQMQHFSEELNLFELPVRNESKNSPMVNFPLYF
jgi:hypothetical protein